MAATQKPSAPSSKGLKLGITRTELQESADAKLNAIFASEANANPADTPIDGNMLGASGDIAGGYATAEAEPTPTAIQELLTGLPSARRFIILGSLLFLAITMLLFGKAMQDVKSRQLETELTQFKITQVTSEEVSRLREEALLDGVPVTADSVKALLDSAAIGRRTAIYDWSSDRQSSISGGAFQEYRISPANLATFNLSQPGFAIYESGAVSSRIGGRVLASWRPMSDGRLILTLSPAADIYGRSPVWISYTLALMVITLISFSMILAFVRQSRAIVKAGGAIGNFERTAKTFEAAGAGSWTVDKDDQVTLPGSFMAALGYADAARTLSVRELSSLIHPKDARQAIALWSSKTSDLTSAQFRMRCADETWYWVAAQRAVAETGEPASGIITSLGEEALQSQTMVQAEARLKDAIESIPEAFLLWDDQGRLTAWNRKFCNIFRIAPSRLAVGQNVHTIARLARDGGDLIRDHFSPPTDGTEQTLEVKLPANRWGHVARRKTAEGGWVCIVTNITDMKRRARAQKRKERELEMTVESLETSRRELHKAVQDYEIEKQRAEDANRSKSEFLANMSHELRTPLNAINGFSEVMQSELYGPLGHPKYGEYIDDILSSGRHLLALIDDILDISKIEAGRMELEIGPVDIEKILREGLRFVEPQTREGGITLTASIASLPSVWADNRAVKQVFINLLSNAVKFTPKSGSVSVTAQADLNSITVLIADTGIGIPKSRMPRLGEPFELVEDHLSKSKRGSGLGLALSKSLMEMQGGILALASEEGRGTVAAFTLPRRAGVAVSLPALLEGKARVLTKDPRPADDVLPRAQNEAAE
jgi:two-component system cell cycle sensor histidine kinase PleC